MLESPQLYPSQAEPLSLRPPDWIWELVDRRAPSREELVGGVPVQHRGGEGAQLLSVRVAGARELGAEPIQVRRALARTKGLAPAA